ncbi:MAG TPA: SPOR domain-containing protein [Cyclobacteriaceae bacterium]|nr:SPOR domain-containing protein [Cyclobacteriaceae bacterium]
MMKKIFPFVLVALVMVTGCKPTGQTTTTTPQEGKYSEDLSSLRPKIEEQPTDSGTAPDKIKRDPKAQVEAQFTVNKQLDAVLDSIDMINLSRKSIEGYTIQVYSGTNKDDALNVKKQLTLSVPNLTSEVQYEQPNFKVRSGRYYTRLEAQKDFNQIRKFFPAAIVVPGQIPIN